METVSHSRYSCALCGATDRTLLYPATHKFFWCHQCKHQSKRNKSDFLVLQVQEIFTVPYYVYALLDPRDTTVRYIGMSKQPEIRLTEHAKEKDYRFKYAWIQELKALGLLPELKIIETVGKNKRYAYTRETYWINYFASIGAPLLNATSDARKKRHA